MISSVPTSLRATRRRGRGRAGRHDPSRSTRPKPHDNDPKPVNTPQAARQRPLAARQHRPGRPSLAPSVAVPTDRREVRMALGKRLSLIFKAKASKALDRAEDPLETLDYSYEKQLELLQQTRRGVADVATSRKRLELQMNQLKSNSDKLEQQGRAALAADREDLAREALSRRSGLQTQQADLQTQYQQLQSQEQQLTVAVQRLQAKIESFRTQKETIKATYTAAQAQTKIGEAFSGISEEMSDVGLAMQRAQDKTAQMQARAGASLHLRGLVLRPLHGQADVAHLLGDAGERLADLRLRLRRGVRRLDRLLLSAEGLDLGLQPLDRNGQLLLLGLQLLILRLQVGLLSLQPAAAGQCLAGQVLTIGGEGRAALLFQLVGVGLQLVHLQFQPLAGGGHVGHSPSGLLQQLQLLLIGVVERLPRVLGAVKRLARLRLEDQRQSLAERHTHFPPVGWHRHARCQARSTGPMLSCGQGSLSCGLGRVDRLGVAVMRLGACRPAWVVSAGATATPPPCSAKARGYGADHAGTEMPGLANPEQAEAQAH